MKTILFTLFSLINSGALAEMRPVTMESPALVREYASGVCSIGFNETGTQCCTGFRIAGDLIMTNFHCLTCVHSVYKALVSETPRFLEPSRFFYSLPSRSQEYMSMAKDRLRSIAGPETNVEQFYIPNNDEEFRKLMNSYPEFFTRINFNNTIDNPGALSESTHAIKEILAMNLELDYAVLRVEGMDDSRKIFKLNYQTLSEGQKLAIMGHPSQGPFPSKKVYDLSKQCKVVDPLYTDVMYRTSVFTHQCSSAPGSSGSPIVDRMNGSVVGIHWGARAKLDVRFGIDMKSILDDLAAP